MARTAGLGQGVRREAESEGGQWTGTPNSRSVGDEGKSGEARAKDTQLTLGGFPACPDDPVYRGSNAVGQGERSQPRPQ